MSEWSLRSRGQSQSQWSWFRKAFLPPSEAERQERGAWAKEAAIPSRSHSRYCAEVDQKEGGSVLFKVMKGRRTAVGSRERVCSGRGMGVETALPLPSTRSIRSAHVLATIMGI